MNVFDTDPVSTISGPNRVFTTPNNLTIINNSGDLSIVTSEYVLCLGGGVLVNDPARILNALGRTKMLFASQPVYPVPGDYELLHRYMMICDHHSHHRFIDPTRYAAKTETATEFMRLAAEYSTIHYAYVNHFPLATIDSFCEVFA